MKVTIKQIARLANVSPTAVSMALNNRKGVSKKTRERILQIAKKLNYTPNYAARSLSGKRSHSLGLLISNIADPFYSELVKGVEEKANTLGYNIILSNTANNVIKEKHYVSTFVSKGVDGIIFSTVTVDDPNIDWLIEGQFPFVILNRLPLNHPFIDRMDSVALNDYSGSYKAIEHLYKLGHDQIAIIAGLMQVSTGIGRTNGAKQAMSDYGLKLNPRFFIECHYSQEQAFQAARRLLGLKKAPTAFFAEGDNMALGVREAVLSAGLKIPEDIAIVGYDNIDVSALTGIELTTINAKTYEMGAMAAEILINKIEEDTPSMVSKIVLDAELVIRKSCGYSLYGYKR